MAENQEQQALPDDMDQDAEFDVDQHVAMQEMMGFSSFGGPPKPKRQPRGPGQGKGFGTGANTLPVQPRAAIKTNTVSSALSATSHPFVPASLPPRPQIRSSTSPQLAVNHLESQANQVEPSQNTPPGLALDPSSPSFMPMPTENHPPEPKSSSVDSRLDVTVDEVAYTHPRTGYTLIKRELAAYERGVTEQVMNKDGSTGTVKVYFKPNFVEDNPWEQLEIAAGLRMPDTT